MIMINANNIDVEYYIEIPRNFIDLFMFQLLIADFVYLCIFKIEDDHKKFYDLTNLATLFKVLKYKLLKIANFIDT